MVKIRELPESEREAIKHLRIAGLAYAAIGEKLDVASLLHLKFSKALKQLALWRR